MEARPGRAPSWSIAEEVKRYGTMAALVADPWGDLSEDLHRLLRVFAEARVANRARAEGWGQAVTGRAF